MSCFLWYCCTIKGKISPVCFRDTTAFHSYFLSLSLCWSLCSAVLAHVPPTLILCHFSSWTNRGHYCYCFPLQQKECEAVAQWCHIAARRGSSAGTQRWLCSGQWVIPHIPPLWYEIRWISLIPEFGSLYVKSFSCWTTNNISRKQFSSPWSFFFFPPKTGCVTLVIFHMQFNCGLASWHCGNQTDVLAGNLFAASWHQPYVCMRKCWLFDISGWVWNLWLCERHG